MINLYYVYAILNERLEEYFGIFETIEEAEIYRFLAEALCKKKVYIRKLKEKEELYVI